MLDKKSRYEITCPHCGKIQYACKSIFHEWGIAEGGHGVCLECKGDMMLIFNEKEQSMKAEKLNQIG